MSSTHCTLCPRSCGTDRSRVRGYCGASDAIQVASVCIHRGEEPPLVGLDGKGIVNVFFAHCNLHCIYCQNHEISSATDGTWRNWSAAEIAGQVCRLLPESAGLVGFVTAAHYADKIGDIVEEIHRRGEFPTVVYNSGGYESVETLRSLEGLVDIYLPDLKYMDTDLAARYSHAADYPQMATAAILEMNRQVGAGLKVLDGIAFRGLIVRHLVLPGHVDNSLRCLDWLADNLPLGVHISLMSQYYPPMPSLPAPLNRGVSASEYRTVTDHYNALGFYNGWLQELSAHENYRPHFADQTHPFDPTPSPNQNSPH